MSKKLSDEFFIKLFKSSDGKSFVWKHFGQLCGKINKQVTEANSVFCSPCFNNNKLKSYKETVSTTNLSQHLREAHGMFLQTKPNLFNLQAYIH